MVKDNHLDIIKEFTDSHPQILAITDGVDPEEGYPEYYLPQMPDIVINLKMKFLL